MRDFALEVYFILEVGSPPPSTTWRGRTAKQDPRGGCSISPVPSIAQSFEASVSAIRRQSVRPRLRAEISRATYDTDTRTPLCFAGAEREIS